jgi:fumarate reductase subunit C
MSRRPYIRKMSRSWWLRRRRTLFYMMRELTSFFIGLYSALLALGLVQLARGSQAWESFIALITSRGGVIFQLLCFAFALFHTVTWFAVTPKAVPLSAPAKAVIGAHYAVWAVISVVVLLLAGRFVDGSIR